VRSVSAEQDSATPSRCAFPTGRWGAISPSGKRPPPLRKFLAIAWNTRGVPCTSAGAARLRRRFRRRICRIATTTSRRLQQADVVRSVLNPASAPVRILRAFVRDASTGPPTRWAPWSTASPCSTSTWALGRSRLSAPLERRRVHRCGDAFTFDRGDFKLHAGAGAELRARWSSDWVFPPTSASDVRAG